MTSLFQPHHPGARLKVSPPEKSELQLKKWQAIIGWTLSRMARQPFNGYNHVPILMSSSISLP